jgi:hypothetical protein
MRDISSKCAGETIAELAMETRKQAEEIKCLRSALAAFVEYFNAIAAGEYESNGRAARIRPFEQVLLDRAAIALDTTNRED